MNRKIGIAVSMIFLLSACQSMDGNALHSLDVNTEGFHVLFFSDDNNQNKEDNYYDVLLELRNTLPNPADLTLIHASDTTQFNIVTYPTLLVIKDGKTLIRIEGKQSKQTIREMLSSVAKQ